MQNIYFLRHFKVIDKEDQKLNSQEFEKWVENYDNFLLEEKELTLPKVKKVYVSSLNRTIKTAKYLNLDFEEIPLLKEVEAKAFINTNIKFSKTFWLIVSRFLWFFNLTKYETKKDTINRVRLFIKNFEDEDTDILIISHGLFLKVLEKELKKIGFSSNIGISTKNSIVYKLEKTI
ncbi:phosphoglycerate mutase family protein [Halarcobacter sp.]|uniref:phosphoglycerate mutase family protein n=1 Tax=Halarcobacter sp. TaxID=2321133 RepID=UPI002AAB60B9|nr:phosphoglycerate mutase family protein [Halarcobacter sp.]